MLLRVAFVAAMAMVVVAPLTLAAYMLVPDFQIRRQFPTQRSETPISAIDHSKRPASPSDASSRPATVGALSAPRRPEEPGDASRLPESRHINPSFRPSAPAVVPGPQLQGTDNKPSETAKPMSPPPAHPVVSEVEPQKVEGIAPRPVPAEEQATTAPAEKQDIVHLYFGPHIIVVCSELNKDQRRRAGCR
jgi:hypothetical protein